MKKCLITALFLFSFAFANAQQWVNGYYKRDGTYVQGHYRSQANSFRYDNYSSRDNLYGGRNPYTGKRGYGYTEFSQPMNAPARRHCYRDTLGYRVCD